MQLLPITYGEIRVGDHVLLELAKWEVTDVTPTTRLLIGDAGHRVQTRGFRVVEVLTVLRAGDDTTITTSPHGGEVTSSDGNELLRVYL